MSGAESVLRDEFNCPKLEFIATGEALEGAFKVPSLRNVAERAPYMHEGQLATLREVVEHYDRAPAAASGRSELHPLRLSERERRQIDAFLRSLSEEKGQ
jgi:cytochrome c peroxidase